MELSTSVNLAPVAPARPAAGYIGGKRNLAGRLTALIETIPHTLYAEPFVGMGGVFLRRRRRPKIELINDLNGEVANLYRVLQVHYVAFMDLLRFQITSRAEFDRLSQVAPRTLTDMQKAARFLYLQRTAFGGKVRGQNFGMSRTTPGRFDVTKLAPLLADVHERLAGVVVEQLPWRGFIDQYDCPGALFYLDPPYWGCEDDYGTDLFGREQFAEMAEVLGRLKGRFVLSLNDCPGVRKTFTAFSIEAVQTTYQLAGNDNAKRVGEVIITG